MKECTKCGIVKDEIEFRKGKGQCKECERNYLKEYRKTEKYKESNIVYQKKYIQSEKGKECQKKYQQTEKYKKYIKTKKYKECNYKNCIKYNLKKQIGETPPPELVEVKLLIYKTKRLCRTLKS